MDRSFLSLVAWVAAIASAVCLLLYLFVFDTMLVPADDPLSVAARMPTLAPGDRILVRRGGEVGRGQLARCASPDPASPYVFARVMGVAGDRVEVKEGRVSVNGQAMPNRHGCASITIQHPVTGEPVTLRCHVEDNGSSTYEALSSMEVSETRAAEVEAGKLFLVSDDRDIHKDSRDFGQLDATTCEHVVFRLWGDSFTDSSRRFSVLY